MPKATKDEVLQLTREWERLVREINLSFEEDNPPYKELLKAIDASQAISDRVYALTETLV